MDTEHDKNLAAAYDWMQLIRAMAGTVMIPIALVFVSPRWAAYAVIPCGIALVVLTVVAMRRRAPFLRPEYRRRPR
jgi:hypothetical protein